MALTNTRSESVFVLACKTQYINLSDGFCNSSVLPNSWRSLRAGYSASLHITRSAHVYCVCILFLHKKSYYAHEHACAPCIILCLHVHTFFNQQGIIV